MLDQKAHRNIHKYRYSGLLIEIYDFIVSILNLPSTYVTCLAICTLLGAPVLSPVLISTVMVSLGLIGLICAYSYYKKSKDTLKNHLIIKDLEESKLKLMSELVNQHEYIDYLKNSGLSQESIDLAIVKAREKLFIENLEFIKSQEVQKERVFSILLNNIKKYYNYLRHKYPKIILAAKILLNISLGILSAFGFVGTIGVLVGGVSAITIIASPVGACIFVAATIAFVGLNLLAFYCCREYLSSKSHVCKNYLNQLKVEVEIIKSTIRFNKQVIDELKEDVVDTVNPDKAESTSSETVLFMRALPNKKDSQNQVDKTVEMESPTKIRQSLN